LTGNGSEATTTGDSLLLGQRGPPVATGMQAVPPNHRPHHLGRTDGGGNLGNRNTTGEFGSRAVECVGDDDGGGGDDETH